jgi:hypothetical protein
MTTTTITFGFGKKPYSIPADCTKVGFSQKPAGGFQLDYAQEEKRFSPR